VAFAPCSLSMSRILGVATASAHRRSSAPRLCFSSQRNRPPQGTASQGRPGASGLEHHDPRSDKQNGDSAVLIFSLLDSALVSHVISQSASASGPCPQRTWAVPRGTRCPTGTAYSCSRLRQRSATPPWKDGCLTGTTKALTLCVLTLSEHRQRRPPGPCCLVEHLFDVSGYTLYSPGQDGIPLSADDLAKPSAVHGGHIAGVEPSVFQNRLGVLLAPATPVTLHDLRAFDHKLSDLSGRQLLRVTRSTILASVLGTGMPMEAHPPDPFQGLTCVTGEASVSPYPSRAAPCESLKGLLHLHRQRRRTADAGLDRRQSERGHAGRPG